MSHDRVIGTIEVRVHHKSASPSVCQAHIYIEGHGYHVIDWSGRRCMSVVRMLSQGQILRVTRMKNVYRASITVGATRHTIFEGILERLPGTHTSGRNTLTL